MPFNSVRALRRSVTNGGLDPGDERPGRQQQWDETVECGGYVRNTVYTVSGQAWQFMRKIKQSERVHHLDRVIVFQSIYSNGSILQTLHEQNDFENAFAVYLVLGSALHSRNSITTEEQSCQHCDARRVTGAHFGIRGLTLTAS